MSNVKRIALTLLTLLLLTSPALLRAQTDEDAIMMDKKLFCIGGTYGHSSWDYYWEGTLHRNNQNLGTVTTQDVMLMGTYGVTKTLNLIVGAPYVWTQASAGVLHGQKGVQDLSGWIKWQATEQHFGKNILSVYALLGGSVPLDNYIADYLPLSIGLHSTTASGRILVDYQLGHFFATGGVTYTWRGDINIDQPSYYTTTLYNTNKVFMPNVESFELRTGYRSNRWVIEGIVSNMTTLGGFDIRRNDMPFPSNKMIASMVGAHIKYDVKWVPGLELNVDGSYTFAGRNVGQARTFDAGAFYILNFNHKKAKATINNQKQ
jgi:hypothetical protein